MTAVTSNHQKRYSANVTFPVVISIVFHIAVFAFATVGIPYFSVEEPDEYESAITVDIFELDELTQTIEQSDTPEELLREPPPKPVERKPVYNQDNVIPDLTNPKPPKIQEPEPIIEPEEPAPEPLVEPEPIVEPEPELVIEPVVEEKKAIIEEKPKPDPHLIKRAPRPKAKPKPKPKKPVKKEVVKKEEPRQDISSLLKSLAIEESEPQPRSAGQQAAESIRMTITDEDRLNASVARCWNINAGGRNAQKLVVKLRVFMNRDATVREVRVSNLLRYAQDQHYKAAADAARRSLLDPRCWPLDLPPEKYELWKNFPYTFDPSGIL